MGLAEIAHFSKFEDASQLDLQTEVNNKDFPEIIEIDW